MPEYQPVGYIPPGMPEMARAYLECAEWAAVNAEVQGKVAVFWSPGSLITVRDTIEGFLLLLQDEQIEWRNALTPTQMGHNLFLTQNRHGAGFWDRGLGKLGEDLTKWAHSMGSQDVEFDEVSNTLSLL